MGTALAHKRRDGCGHRQLSTGEEVLQEYVASMLCHLAAGPGPGAMTEGERAGHRERLFTIASVIGDAFWAVKKRAYELALNADTVNFGGAHCAGEVQHLRRWCAERADPPREASSQLPTPLQLQPVMLVLSERVVGKRLSFREVEKKTSEVEGIPMPSPVEVVGTVITQ